MAENNGSVRSGNAGTSAGRVNRRGSKQMVSTNKTAEATKTYETSIQYDDSYCPSLHMQTLRNDKDYTPLSTMLAPD